MRDRRVVLSPMSPSALANLAIGALRLCVLDLPTIFVWS
jgi:hypothetical protein